MYLILWETNPAAYPSDTNEQIKVIISHMEKIKKDMQSGDLMMWGVSVGGGGGFAVAKDNPKQSFANSMFYSPYVKSEVRPMLTADEMIDVMKSMQK